VKQINAALAIAIVALLALSLFFAVENFLIHKNQAANQSKFYIGVECGYNNVTLCKALIDKVKNYTNLFVIGSTDIVKNASLLNDVVDYTCHAGMHFAVYFSPIQNYTDLGENATISITLLNGTITQLPSYQSSLPMAWIKNATSKYGDRFLGAYIFDEPGGNQIDGGVQRVANTTSEQSYQSMANAFVGTSKRSRTSGPMFSKTQANTAASKRTRRLFFRKALVLTFATRRAPCGEYSRATCGRRPCGPTLTAT
jgi:hypothetical protein